MRNIHQTSKIKLQMYIKYRKKRYLNTETQRCSTNYHLLREHVYIFQQKANSTQRTAIISIPEITTKEKTQREKRHQKSQNIVFTVQNFHQLRQGYYPWPCWVSGMLCFACTNYEKNLHQRYLETNTLMQMITRKQSTLFSKVFQF